MVTSFPLSCLHRSSSNARLCGITTGIKAIGVLPSPFSINDMTATLLCCRPMTLIKPHNNSDKLSKYARGWFSRPVKLEKLTSFDCTMENDMEILYEDDCWPKQSSEIKAP